MQQRWAASIERGSMQRGTVAFMAIEAPVRKETMVKRHEGITQNFRNDGGAGDGDVETVSLDDGMTRTGQRWRPCAIDQGHFGRLRQRLNGLLHGVKCRAMNVGDIDHIGRDNADANVGSIENVAARALALERGQTLGVIDAGTGKTPRASAPSHVAHGQHDGGRDDRTGPRPPPDFIDAGDPRNPGRERLKLTKSEAVAQAAM